VRFNKGTIQTPRKVVSIIFAALVVLMLTVSACIVDPNALAGTSSEQQSPSQTSTQLAALQQQINALNSQIVALNQTIAQRNQQIKQLSDTINAWKAANPGKTATPEIQAQMNQLSQLQTTQQTDMLKLQQLMAQYTQANAMLSNMLYQINQANKNIIKNMP